MAGTAVIAMGRWQAAVLALGLSLSGLLGWLGWQSARPEWRAYQVEYARVAQVVGGPESAPVEIQQIEVAVVARADRCTTCHLGVTNPGMAGAAEPFRAHSKLTKSHPPEAYGCTVCHGGEGRAVTRADAHGEAPGQHGRLLPRTLQEATCYGCHGETGLPIEAVVAVAEGAKLANEHACLRCHQVDGDGGSIGPDLSGIASQRNWVELYAHLLDPAATVPGSTMPDFGLKRSEATALTAFLLTLRGPREQVVNVRYLAMDMAADDAAGYAEVSATAASAEAAPAAWLAPGYSGEALFAGLDCGYCHRVGEVGGEVGPALTHIGRARSPEWLRKLLEDPASVFPAGQMPNYDLTPAQVDALAVYLTELK